jgi:hypothetical protein
VSSSFAFVGLLLYRPWLVAKGVPGWLVADEESLVQIMGQMIANYVLFQVKIRIYCSLIKNIGI